MVKPKILYVSQEITPYLKSSHMSNIGRFLPQGTQERKKEIRTFMPRFGNINERRNQLHEVIRLSGMNLIINDIDHPLIIKVASIQAARMQVYFIDNEDYFHRKALFSDKDKFFNDNDERAIFYARGVLETVKKLRWSPDIIHCHGWFSSLVPMYLKKIFQENPLFSDSKIVYSIYNDGFEDPLDGNFTDKLMFEGLPEADLNHYKTKDYKGLIKSAVDYSDAIIYSEDTIDPEIDSYVKSTKKQCLPFMGDNEYIDAYNKLYEQLLEE